MTRKRYWSCVILDRGRQMFGRARKHLASERYRFIVTPEQLENLMRQFARTCASGDLQSLVALLSLNARDALVASH